MLDFIGTPIAAHAMLKGRADVAVRQGGTIYVAPETLDELRRADAGVETLKIVTNLALIDLPSIGEIIDRIWMDDFEKRMVARGIPA